MLPARLRSHITSLTVGIGLVGTSACSLLDLETLSDGGAGGETIGTTAASGGSGGTMNATSSSVGGTSSSSSGSLVSTTSGSGGELPLLEGCVLLLHMDEDSWVGDGAVIDSSGMGNHGTATGAQPLGAGKFGGAASFTGDDTIVVANDDSLQPDTALSYMAWVRPTALGGDPGIFSKRVGFGDSVAFTMFLSPSPEVGGYTWWGDIESSRFRANTLVAINQWNHLVIVYDGTASAADRTKLYLNGVASLVPPGSPAPVSMSPNGVALTLGFLPGGGGHFDGELDEVVVWRRALGPDDVTRLFEMQTSL